MSKEKNPYWFMVYGHLCDRPVTDPKRCAHQIRESGFASVEDALAKARSEIATAALKGHINGKVYVRVYDAPEGAPVLVVGE